MQYRLQDEINNPPFYSEALVRANTEFQKFKCVSVPLNVRHIHACPLVLPMAHQAQRSVSGVWKSRSVLRDAQHLVGLHSQSCPLCQCSQRNSNNNSLSLYSELQTKPKLCIVSLQISQATTETVKAEPRGKRSSVIFNILKVN